MLGTCLDCGDRSIDRSIEEFSDEIFRQVKIKRRREGKNFFFNRSFSLQIRGFLFSTERESKHYPEEKNKVRKDGAR